MCAEQIKKDTKRPRVDGVRGSDQNRGDEGSNETEDGEAKTRTGQDRGLSLDEASGCPAIRRAGLTGACDVSGLPSTYPSTRHDGQKVDRDRQTLRVAVQISAQDTGQSGLD
ncbi:hypothetical protein E4U15_005126 [Claviceps sp. LM218 group G6]|nr:hypothetical protein E4U15_005126 [Claviceps sp. LM218 group G6]